MTIEWSNSFSNGVIWQDRQHKELFRRINALLEAMSVGSGKTEIATLFDFLDEYFVVHFEAEEREMHRLAFVDSASHVKEHVEFMERISTLKKECEEGASTALVIKVQRQVVDWLINHIGGIDRKLGAFLVRGDGRPKAAR